MELADARRYARHIALPEVGAEGQRRIFAARVLLVDSGPGQLAIETAALYLGFAGIKFFVVVARSNQGSDVPWLSALQHALPGADFRVRERPQTGSGWAQALHGIAVATRADFADDSFVEACRRQHVPAVVCRPSQAEAETVLDVMSMRPAPGPILDVPSIPPSPARPAPPATPEDGAAAVLAGTLAAAEVLWLLVGRAANAEASGASTVGVIRHLRLPLTHPTQGSVTLNLPWPPADPGDGPELTA